MRCEPVLAANDLRKVFRLHDSALDRLLFALSRGHWGVHRDHLALDGVSFALQPGETLAVLGANGAGKTTLLGLIAGILRPTSGTLVKPSRIGALISLAAGFDPEATGRANLRHWGRIHADGPFTGAEEAWIEEFTELGKDLDRPLRTYSQGMQLRLGFAVTTARRPDLLIIDEILAVGDIFFRQKCHARIAEMVHDGTAALLASHNFPEIVQFCRKAIVMDQGRIFFQGPAHEAVSRYLAYRSRRQAAHRAFTFTQPANSPTIPWPEGVGELDLSSGRVTGMEFARIRRCALLREDGTASQVFAWGQTFRLLIEVETLCSIQVPIVSWSLLDQRGFVVTGSASHIVAAEDWPEGLPAGACWRVAFDITAQLRFDEYTLDVGLGEMPLNIYQSRQGLPPEQLAGHVTVLGKVHGAACVAIIPDLARQPSIIPHGGLAYLPCRMHHKPLTTE